MTGFGSSVIITNEFTLKAELKTLNSKFFDPILKIPRELQQWESDIRTTLEKGLQRGKINLALELDRNGHAELPVDIDENLFLTYVAKFRDLSEKSNEPVGDIFKLALQSPNVVNNKEGNLTSVTSEIIAQVLSEAVDNCSAFREEEGKTLTSAMLNDVKHIEQSLKNISALDPKRAENIKSRIENSLNEISDKVVIDQNRFEQELIYYLEKLDINEEKVRLQSHLDHFREIMEEGGVIGKKIGFIAQEIGREINTIGSKANNADIQKEVIGMKESLEKIKEQSMNLL